MRGLILFSLTILLLSCSTKSTAEKQQTEKIIDVNPVLIELPERHYLVLRQELPLDNMNGFFGIESKALSDAAKAAGIEPTGPITGLFYRWDTEAGIGDAAVALPVKKGTTLQAYVPITLPAQRAFAAQWDGPYTGLGAIHYALEAQFQLKKLQPGLPSIEEYYQGPVDGVAEENFSTRIIYPIAE